MKKYIVLLIILLFILFNFIYGMFEVDFIPKKSNDIICNSGYILELKEEKRKLLDASFKL